MKIKKRLLIITIIFAGILIIAAPAIADDTPPPLPDEGTDTPYIFPRRALLEGLVTEGSDTLEPRILEPRVIGGGGVTPENLYPWMVSFQLSGVHFCGGSLISEKWVITAAHCWTDDVTGAQYPILPGDTVVLGEYDFSTNSGNEQVIVPAQVYLHPLFDPYPYSDPWLPYDIALVELSSPAVLNDYVQPIALDYGIGNLVDLPAVIAGWGSTIYPNPDNIYPDILQHGLISVLSDSYCSVYDTYGPDSQICGGLPDYSVDACLGDSGGPMMVTVSGTTYLAGVTSWGKGCAVEGQPGVYADVSAAYPWIYETFFPAQPVPIAPSGEISDNTPLYQWNEVATATDYLVVAKNADTDTWVYWQWLDAGPICSGGVCAIEQDITLMNGNYWWALVAQNSVGIGPWSPLVSFQVNSGTATEPPGMPTLIAPSGEIADNTPMYQWNEVATATDYLVIAKNADTDTWVYWQWLAAGSVCSSGVCEVQQDITLADGNHWWAVVAQNSVGVGPWTPEMAFLVNTGGTVTPPGQPTLIAPSGEIADNTPLYQWNEVATATDYLVAVKNTDTATWVYTGSLAAGPICSGGVCEINPGVTLADGNHFWTVTAQNSAGDGPVSAEMAFVVNTVVATEPPGQPVPIAPVGEITENTPFYQWNEVATATDYLVIAKNTDTDTWMYWQWLDAGPLCSAGVCEVQQDITLADGNHWWAVVAQNSAGVGPWTPEIAFLVNTGGTVTPPGQPTLIAPSGEIADNTPLYKWNEVATATDYLVAVKNTDTATWVYTGSLVAGPICSGGVCEINPGVTLADGNHFWTVTAQNSAGDGPVSAEMAFVVNTVVADEPPGQPVQIAPSGEISDNTPLYKWNEVATATDYLVIAKNADTDTWVYWQWLAAGPLCSAGVCETQQDITLADGNHWWAVVAQNSAGVGPWSPSMTFQVNTAPATEPPGTPVLIAPSGEITENTPFYQWNEVATATDYLVVAKNTDTDTWMYWQWLSAGSVCSGGVCETQQDITLADGNHYWAVVAQNGAGVGLWSPLMTFLVNTGGTVTPPGQPTLIAPSGEIADNTPLYQWNEVATATDYLVAVKNTDTDTWMYSESLAAGPICSGGVCQIDPGVTLADGNHFWTVTAQNSAGDGPISAQMTFLVNTAPASEPPGQPTLIAPSGTINEPTPAYQWNEVATATDYLVVAKNTDTDTWMYWQWLSAGSVCSSGVCETQQDIPLADGNHYWAVVAQNSAGVGLWSPLMTFKVSLSNPSKPVLIAPSGVITDNTPMYQWNEVPEATDYLVIVKNSDTDTWMYWQWLAAGPICSAGVCEVQQDITLADGNHWWAVVGMNSAGVGTWSPEMVFEVIAP